MARHPHQTAVVDGARRIRYVELFGRVSALATGLSHLGVKRGERVVLQLSNGLELLESLLAILRTGAVPVLALPARRRSELESFCTRTGAVALVVQNRSELTNLLPMASAVRESCPSLKHVIVHGDALGFDREFVSLATLRELGGTLPQVTKGHAPSGQAALLTLLGAGRGLPSVVARSHDACLRWVRESVARYALSEQTRYLAALPMGLDLTLGSPTMLGTLQAGGSVVFCESLTPEAVFGLLVNEGITLTAALPSMLQRWLDARTPHAHPVELARLTLQVRGAQLDAQLAHAVSMTFGCRVQQDSRLARAAVSDAHLHDDRAQPTCAEREPTSHHDGLAERSVRARRRARSRTAAQPPKPHALLRDVAASIGVHVSIKPIAPYALPARGSWPACRAPWSLEPSRAALLVHDMQDYFLEPYGKQATLAELTRNVRGLLSAFRRLGAPVIFSAQPGEQSRRERGLLRDLWGEGIVAQPGLAGLSTLLPRAPDDLVLPKRRYSAFHDTALLELLTSRGKDQLVICGVYAHIGCLATALDAFMLGVQPFMAADAVADFSREDHDVALRQVARTCGVVTTTDDLVARMAEILPPEART